MKNIKNLFILCLTLLIFAVLFIFTGCADSVDYNLTDELYDSNEDYTISATTYAPAARADKQASAYEKYAEADYNYAYAYDNISPEAVAEAPAAAAPSAPRTSGVGNYFTYLTNLPAERKIIRNANLVIEVESAETAYDNILLNVAKFGGYEASRDMRIGSNNYMAVNATLKIPSNKLDMFLNEIKNEGIILSSTVSSSDVTDEYFDSMTRLETLEKTLAKYYEFLDNAKDVDEQLKVAQYINDITYQIEQIKGRLTRWDSLVEYSTITLYLYRPADPEPETTTEEPTTEPETEPETTTERQIEWSIVSPDDMQYNILQGIVDTCSAILRVIQAFITWFISVSPVLIPVLIVLFLLYKYARKKIREYKNNKKKNDIDNI